MEAIFVGRQRQLGRLDAFLERALAGHGQLAFLTGEPGAGKTRLIREFARRAEEAHPDLIVGVGECNAQTGECDAYLPFKEILGLLTGNVEPQVAAGTITPTTADRLKKGLFRVGNVLAEVGPGVLMIFGGVPGWVLGHAGQVLLRQKGVIDRLHQLSDWQKKSAGEAPHLDQNEIFEQYTGLLTRLAASTPLVLVLDDLQWADTASLNLLFHLGRKIQDSRILILGTYRPNDIALGRGDERHPLVPVLNELKRYYGEIEVSLDLLEHQAEDRNEIRSFVGEYIDRSYAPHQLGAEFQLLIVERTEGNPLFTVELLHHLEEKGILAQDNTGVWRQTRHLELGDLPARVEAVIEERVLRLDEELRRALAAASVEGEEFTAQVVALVQRLEEGFLLGRLIQDAEKRHQLVVEHGLAPGDGQQLYLFRFRHSLFQHHLYEGLTPMERALLHREVGLSLETLFADRTDEIAVQLAHHFSRAHVPEKAFEYYLQAGDRARESLAFEEALDHYRRALEVFSEGPARQARVLERVGDIYRLWGEAEKGLEQYQAALDLGDLEDKTLEVRLHRKAALACVQRRDLAAAARFVEAALAGVRGIGDPLEEARVALAAAELALYSRDGAKAREMAERCLALAEPLDASVEVAQAYEILALFHHVVGDIHKGMDYAARRETIFLPTHAMAESLELHLCVFTLTIHGPRPYAETEQVVRKMLADMQEIGGVRCVTLVRGLLGQILYLQGKWEEALEQLRLALEEYQQVQSYWGEGFVLALLAEIEMARGDAQAARSHLDRAQARARADDTTWVVHFTGRIHADSALLALKEGDVKEAHKIVGEALACEEEWWGRCQICETYFWPVAVEVALSAGDLHQAHHFQERLEKAAEQWGEGPWPAAALYIRGLLCLTEGRINEAIAALEQARAIFSRKGQPYDMAHSLYGLAQAYQRSGQPGDDELGQGCLAEAVGIFERLGAVNEIEQSRALAMKIAPGHEAPH